MDTLCTSRTVPLCRRLDGTVRLHLSLLHNVIPELSVRFKATIHTTSREEVDLWDCMYA